MTKRFDNEVVLAFGDTHFPYSHKYWLEFLSDVASDYSPDRVIHMGDLYDIYSVSAYPKDTDHPDSWHKEIKKARKMSDKLAQLFPDLEIMESNHDDRAYKKGRVSGIPREFLVPFRDIVGAPSGWKWHRDLTITVDSSRDQLFFAHTKTGGAVGCARDKGCTSIIGHHHTKFGMTAFRPNKKTLYAVDAGCLVSDKGSPFAYTKGNRNRAIQGCAVIISGKPHMVEL